MKISYKWLQQHIELPLNVEKVSEILTAIGLEVEGVEAFESIKGGLKGVVVGEVLTCEQHPNADRLRVTTVDLGNGEPVQIVCGAPNVAAGQKVPVATIGTVLYDAEGKEFEIKKGKIRGEESHGMICAEDELGIGTSHEGIMVLEATLQPGTPLAEVLQIENDYQLEIGLTPNRADAMGHYGVARDLKAAVKQQLKQDLAWKHDEETALNIGNQPFAIQVEDAQDCPRYAGLVIEGLTIQPSPEWLPNRLKTIGLNPINNVVDATNYILHDLGQPLHAFDLAKVKGNKIVVKKVAQDTPFITLDGVERKLSSEDLMICNAEQPMCIAGVFGGQESGVSASTTAIFLESAYFNPITIRKTAKRHGLSTDASFRFERGIDPNMIVKALQKAAQLIIEIAGGTVTSSINDIYPEPITDFEIDFKYKTLTQLLGESIPKTDVESILQSLDIKFVANDNGWKLQVPPYRVDVQREADVVEEILRIYGYNTITIPEKLNSSIVYSDKFNPNSIQEKAANHLASLGFNETMNNSLQKLVYNEWSANINPEHTVKILNPLSQDLGAMRQSLLWGGLETILYNINRKQADLKLFEFGKTYHKYDSGYVENRRLSILVSGKRLSENWINNTQVSDFYYAKGIVENLLAKLKIKNLKYSPVKNDVFSEGITIESGKKSLVEIGLVNQSLLKKFDISQNVIYANILWDNVLEVVQYQKMSFVELPKFPSSRKDLALLLDKDVQYKDLYHTAFQTEKSILRQVNLFDVYEGKNLPEGKKSYALSFELRDDEKTLNDKIIEKTMSKLLQAFEKQQGAELRK